MRPDESCAPRDDDPAPPDGIFPFRVRHQGRRGFTTCRVAVVKNPRRRVAIVRTMPYLDRRSPPTGRRGGRPSMARTRHSQLDDVEERPGERRLDTALATLLLAGTAFFCWSLPHALGIRRRTLPVRGEASGGGGRPLSRHLRADHASLDVPDGGAVPAVRRQRGDGPDHGCLGPRTHRGGSVRHRAPARRTALSSGGGGTPPSGVVPPGLGRLEPPLAVDAAQPRPARRAAPPARGTARPGRRVGCPDHRRAAATRPTASSGRRRARGARPVRRPRAGGSVPAARRIRRRRPVGGRTARRVHHVDRGCLERLRGARHPSALQLPAADERRALGSQPDRVGGALQQPAHAERAAAPDRARAGAGGRGMGAGPRALAAIADRGRVRAVRGGVDPLPARHRPSRLRGAGVRGDGGRSARDRAARVARSADGRGASQRRPRRS